MYLLTPVSDFEGRSAKMILRTLLDSGWYVFGWSVHITTRIDAGDRICFYEKKVGVVANATIAGRPSRESPPSNPTPGRFPWAIPVKDVLYFFDNPTVVDAALRARMDAFRKRDPFSPWSWFVQVTHEVTEHDYELLVHR